MGGDVHWSRWSSQVKSHKSEFVIGQSFPKSKVIIGMRWSTKMRLHFIETVLWETCPSNKVGQVARGVSQIRDAVRPISFHYSSTSISKKWYFWSQLARHLGLIICCSFSPRKDVVVTCPIVLEESQNWALVWEKQPRSPC